MAIKKDRAPRSGAQRGRRAVITILIIVAVLAAATAGAGIYVTNMDTIFPKVRVDGRDVGSLTCEQALAKLQEAGWDDGADKAVTVSLPLGEKLTVTAGEAGAEVSATDAALAAYNYCHGGNIFSNLVTFLRCAIVGADVKPVPEVDEEAVRAAISESVGVVTEGLMSSGMEVKDDTLYVVKGASAVTIDADELYDMISAALIARSYTELEYEADITASEELDIDELYASVHCQAEDAYYDSESGGIVDEIVGLDFDKAEAKSLWNSAEYGDTVEIPLDVTEPELTAEALGKMLFRDELGTITTYLYGSSENRISNVRLACSILSDTVLEPGETFSYNGSLGERTAARGFKSAPAYSGGQVVQEIGGGICQVSSTIYNAALLANLTIADRTCHYFPVGYLPPGLDATVSWKIPDFKFTNSRDYPIRLEIAVSDDGAELTATIYGTDVDGSYVEMTYATWEIFTNEEYPEVATGYKAASYRNIYDKDGNLLSHEIEAYSTYHYHDEDIKLPEESAEPTTEPSAQPTTEPSPETTDAAAETKPETSPATTEPAA